MNLAGGALAEGRQQEWNAIQQFVDNYGMINGGTQPQIIRDVDTEIQRRRSQWLQEWNTFSARFNETQSPPSVGPVDVFRNLVELACFHLKRREDHADNWLIQQLQA